MQLLNLMQLPLCGSALIEASAGTGKTYTIAALYLRLVLGHGGQAPLLPPDILVVTFTEAATAELKGRIRQRLTQAAAYFSQQCSQQTNEQTVAADPFLAELAQQFAQADWPACSMRLELAAQWMDDAAVSTIHGWCNRMLSEHAFASGSQFEQQLSTDLSTLQSQVVQDYWRSFVYPLPLTEYLCLRQYWQTPADLGHSLQPIWPLPAKVPAGSVCSWLQQEISEKQQQLAALKQPWSGWLPQITDLIEQGRSAGLTNNSKLRADYVSKWLAGLALWAADPAMLLPEIGAGLQRLTPEGMAEAWKGTAPTHPAFEALAALPEIIKALPNASLAIRQHALAWCQQRFARLKQQQAVLGFDDLLTQLQQALLRPEGEALARQIRAQFPLALIDEFQDTDPVQYQIFQRIYQPEANRQDCGLLLIGDPKQAIYAFRGADIYTYLAAKQATAPRHYSLATNFRSSQALVEVVNQLFLGPEQREQGRGAFLFRQDSNPLPFIPVQAKGRSEQFWRAEHNLPALAVHYLPTTGKALAKGAYLQHMAAAAATQISQLLNESALQQCGFKQGEQLQPLLPQHIAVLVNNQQEADQMRAALAQCAIRSVYLSDKGSVFDSPLAQDLWLWLCACAEPRQERLLRAALASAALDWSYAQLAELQQDEWQLELWTQKFVGFQQLWQRSGILPLVRRLIIEFGLVERLARQADGERQLTDLLHLAELLQQASRTLEGEAALLRYLAEHMAGQGDLSADQQKLRLESDAALVRVVTIHKSKGLEYPLVFLPFIAAARPLDASKLPYRYHDAAQQLQLSFVLDETTFALAEQERLAEDLRKLYVALTRAQHYCWLGLAALKESSAIAYLLDASATFDLVDLASQLTSWQALPALSVAPLPAVAAMPRCLLASTPQQQIDYAQMPQRQRHAWWIASYSAIANGAVAHSVVAQNEPQLAAELYQELQQEVADSHATEDVSSQPMTKNGIAAAFLRGATAGSFLHDELEWAAEQGFAQVAADPTLWLHRLVQSCSAAGHIFKVRTASAAEQWQRRLFSQDLTETVLFDRAEDAVAHLCRWLLQLLQLQLLPPSVASANPNTAAKPVQLSSLTNYKAELEFLIAADRVSTKALDALLFQYIWPEQPRPQLLPNQLNGMLKGFIDLSFKVADRYYVADYKSNFIELGQYSAEAMQQVMLDKRYDLQAALYGLALHRLLKSRKMDYQAAEHLGSALYWFIRGDEPAVTLDSTNPWLGQTGIEQAVALAEAAAPIRNATILVVDLPLPLILALDQLFSQQQIKEAACN